MSSKSWFSDSMEDIEKQKKFDLSIWRSSQQRIEMVTDPDCPYSVLETVATHDLDEEVVLAILLAAEVDEKILDIISKKWNYSKDELIEKQYRAFATRDDKRSAVFCGVPWNHVSTTAGGEVRMCCQMINSAGLPGNEAHGQVYKEDGKALTVWDDISEHRNAEQWKSLRREFLAGNKPKICDLCWHEEENGIGSRRQWTDTVFPYLFEKAIFHTAEDGSINHEDFPIEHWDLRFGNKCNLACRSCGPGNSDLWYKDWKALTGKDSFGSISGEDDIVIEYDSNNKPFVKDSPFEWFNRTDLVGQIKSDIKDIKRFYFTGGEPTINHTHRQLLQYCIDNDHAKRITLDYNTNMAGVPNAIFEQWKSFKLVNLGMSIDGIYEHFDFIRYPGKWDTAYKNLKRADDMNTKNITACITMTVSIYNVLHFLDMQWWMREQNWKIIDPNIIVHNLYGPKHLNTQNLPVEIKEYINNRYSQFLEDVKAQWPEEKDKGFVNLLEIRMNSILHHMNAVEPDAGLWDMFIEQTEKLDAIRGENWRESISEIWDLVEKYQGQELRKNNVQLATTSKK